MHAHKHTKLFLWCVLAKNIRTATALGASILFPFLIFTFAPRHSVTNVFRTSSIPQIYCKCFTCTQICPLLCFVGLKKTLHVLFSKCPKPHFMLMLATVSLKRSAFATGKKPFYKQQFSSNIEKSRDNKKEQRTWSLKEIPKAELHVAINLNLTQNKDGTQKKITLWTGKIIQTLKTNYDPPNFPIILIIIICTSSLLPLMHYQVQQFFLVYFGTQLLC